jgi:tetratricopeptide (TPR) repeat protein
VSLLSKMAADAQAAGKPDVHDALAKRADDLLAEFAQRAETDADMARTLGRAYLAVGNGAAAEKWLGVALAARKDDIELHSQLAQALALEGKTDAALTELRAAFDLDPKRADIGLDLATRYEAAGKNDEAAAMYGKLLAADSPTTETRTHAGLFYARTGDAKSAAAQGEALLAADAGSAVGTYLKGEGEYAAGQLEKAKADFKTAATKDPQAMYLDGWGRAAEAISVSQNATDARDEALVQYNEAVKADPKLVGSQLGLGRIHLARREWDASIAAFEAARALGSTSPDLAYGEGMAYAETNKPDKAIEYLQRAVNQQPRADAYNELAKIYLGKNDAKHATAAYAEASRLAQDDERAGKPQVSWLTDALWQLGQLYADGGADAKACKAWGDYVARNPQDLVKVRNVKTQMLGMRCH